MQEKKNRELTRRSLMEWLGKATVFGLSSNALLSLTAMGCEEESDIQKPFSDGALECAANHTFPLEPDKDSDKLWTERTVDPQSLSVILSKWVLVVDGMVENPLQLNFAQVLELPRQDQVTDFHCVEGWSVYDVPWNGFHISSLTELVKPAPEATHINLQSWQRKYSESMSLNLAMKPKTMFAYGVNCSTLPLVHGFPLRLVIPHKYGYKGPKYVSRIEFTDSPVEGYWVARGYPEIGNVTPDRLRPGKY